MPYPTGIEQEEDLPYKGQFFDRGGSVYNVMAFGATGDGVTDDTVAVQSAITAVIAAGNRIIYMPKGTYVVTSLTNTSQVLFVGPGKFNKGIYAVQDEAALGDIILPSAFDWFEDTVALMPDGSGTTSFDIDARKPLVTKKYYVRHTGGNDSNDGLTYENALATVAAALAKTDVDEIVLQSGIWDRSACAWGAKTLTRNVAITVLGGGRAVFLGSDLGISGSWSEDITHTNTYKLTRGSLANHRAVWDALYKDANDDWMQYTLAESAAAVDTTPGSYYTDGTDVWVRCIDDRAPDDDLHVFLDTSCIVTGPYTLWIENIDFAGVQNVVVRAATENARPTYYAKNCTYKYCGVDSFPGRGGLRVEGGDTYLVDCVAARNYRDGFTYHSYDATLLTPRPRAFELRCIGRHNGLLEDPANGSGNNQGSTIHDGGSVLRINCQQYENEGPNIEDVGEGTYSYNIGNYAYNSRKNSDSRNYNSGSSADVDDHTTMYLVSCRSGGRRTYDAITSADGLLYTYRTPIETYAGVATQFQQFNPFLSTPE